MGSGDALFADGQTARMNVAQLPGQQQAQEQNHRQSNPDGQGARHAAHPHPRIAVCTAGETGHQQHFHAGPRLRLRDGRKLGVVADGDAHLPEFGVEDAQCFAALDAPKDIKPFIASLYDLRFWDRRDAA